jgi:type I restriction enzyme S subunit
MSLPAYPAYRDSGVPWLGPVPAHWEVMPLKRAACLCTDRAADRSFPVGLKHIESGRAA